MKIETNTNQNIEQQKELQIQLQSEDEKMLQQVDIPFSQLLSQRLSDDNIISSDNIDYNYDSLNMTLEDAAFFINMTQNIPYNYTIVPNENFKSLMQTEVAQNVISTKPVEITNKLTELIEKAQNTQKPVRISFDNDVSVILKIDKHGKISAEFIPGSIEVENYLRNNIASLKQRFEEQNLPYNDIMYRQNSRQNRNRKNRGEN